MNLDPIIEKHARTFGIEFNLVKAFCLVESSFEPHSAKYESLYSYIFHPEAYAGKKGNNVNVVTERMLQMTSWGPMQLMGAVARERGYDGFLPDLCNPDIGIYYSCKHLKTYLTRYPNLDDAIASYNAGSPRKKTDGRYVNQEYVDLIKGYMESLSKEH